MKPRWLREGYATSPGQRVWIGHEIEVLGTSLIDGADLPRYKVGGKDGWLVWSVPVDPHMPPPKPTPKDRKP